jgi:hypothetical protein
MGHGRAKSRAIGIPFRVAPICVRLIARDQRISESLKIQLVFYGRVSSGVAGMQGAVAGFRQWRYSIPR